MNTNTISQLNILTQGNVTSESAFPTNAGGSNTTTRATVQVNAATQWNPTSSAATQLANACVFDGRPFKVKACFKATGGASGNFTGKLYWNSGANTNLTTFTSDVSLVSSGAVATAAKTISIYLEVICLWDSGSQQLTAVDGLCINGIAACAILNSGAFTLTNTTTPVSTTVSLSSSLQFFATGLFGSSNAGNSVTLTELSIEAY